MRRNRDLSELGILDLTGIITPGVVRNLGTYEQAKKILESVGLGDLIMNREGGPAIAASLESYKFNFIKAPADIPDKFEELIIPIQHEDYKKAEGVLESLTFGAWSEQDQEFTIFAALNYFYDSKTYEIGIAEN